MNSASAVAKRRKKKKEKNQKLALRREQPRKTLLDRGRHVVVDKSLLVVGAATEELCMSLVVVAMKTLSILHSRTVKIVMVLV